MASCSCHFLGDSLASWVPLIAHFSENRSSLRYFEVHSLNCTMCFLLESCLNHKVQLKQKQVRGWWIRRHTRSTRYPGRGDSPGAGASPEEETQSPSAGARPEKETQSPGAGARPEKETHPEQELDWKRPALASMRFLQQRRHYRGVSAAWRRDLCSYIDLGCVILVSDLICPSVSSSTKRD